VWALTARRRQFILWEVGKVASRIAGSRFHSLVSVLEDKEEKKKTFSIIVLRRRPCRVARCLFSSVTLRTAY